MFEDDRQGIDRLTEIAPMRCRGRARPGGGSKRRWGMGHQGTASPRAIVALPGEQRRQIAKRMGALERQRRWRAREPLAGDRVAKQPPAMGLSMQHKLLHDSNGQRTYVVVLDKGEEVLGALAAFARMQRIHTAQLTAIGAFSDVV